MSAGVELWLVRHGETEWSLSGAHTSRTDIPLTERGRERAADLKTYLEDTKFAAVFTSPMQRARQTADLAGYGDVAKIDEGLREWDYGIYEGKTTKEIRETEPGWNVWVNEIRGGETAEKVGVRADGVIARALAAAAPAGSPNDRPAKVALFAHAHILRILAARWVGLEARSGQIFALGTGSVSVLGWERETHVIEHWNRDPEEGSK